MSRPMTANFTIDFLLGKNDQAQDSSTMPPVRDVPLPPIVIPSIFSYETTNDIPPVPQLPFYMDHCQLPFQQQCLNSSFIMNAQQLPFMMPPVDAQNMSSAQISTSALELPSKPDNQQQTNKTDRYMKKWQRQILENEFLKIPRVSKEDCKQLSHTTGLSIKRIRGWFKNKRAHTKKVVVDEELPGRYLTKRQREVLESEFSKTPRLSRKDIKKLADQTGASIPRIRNWFANKRAFVKKEASPSTDTVSVPRWKDHDGKCFKFSRFQRDALTKQFYKCVDLGNEEITQLVATTGLTAGQIRSWFSLRLNALKQQKRQANPLITTREIWELLEKDGVHSPRNQQNEILLVAFEITQKPTAIEIDRLSKATGRSNQAIRSWFAHRVRNLKKKNAEDPQQETPTED